MQDVKHYYARCQALDKTPQYDRDVALLRSLGFDVWEADQKEKEASYRKEGMEFFLREVRKCDALAFRALPSGKIPAGVYKEIMTALEEQIPVIELPSALSQRGLSVEQTREYLREIGFR